MGRRAFSWVLAVAAVGVGCGSSSSGTPGSGAPSGGGMAQAPKCVPPGMVQCPSGTFFAASPTESGCFPNGTMVTGEIPNAVDMPMGTCASVGDVAVACDTPASCDFCFKSNAAVPTGCYTH